MPNAKTWRRLRMVVDCANGAMTTVAPAVLRELGFDLTVIAANRTGGHQSRCWLHTSGVACRNRSQAAVSLGVAFDGDGDRAIFVDGNGRILDGITSMFMCAKQMKAGPATGETVVPTVMSKSSRAWPEKRTASIYSVLASATIRDGKMQKQNFRSAANNRSSHIADYLFTGDGLLLR